MRLGVLRTAAIISTRAFSTIEQRHLVTGSAITKLKKNYNTQQKAAPIIIRITLLSFFLSRKHKPDHGVNCILYAERRDNSDQKLD
jgi:hypothetical protein